MKLAVYLLFFIVMHINTAVFAQPAAAMKRAKEQITQRHYGQALRHLDSIENQQASVLYHRGLCHFYKNNPAACSYFMRAYLQRLQWFWQEREQAYGYLAQAYHRQEKFDSAAYYYKKKIEKMPAKSAEREHWKLALRQCEWAPQAWALSKQKSLAAVAPLSDAINSEGNETALYIYPNPPYNLAFSSDKEQQQQNIYAISFSVGDWMFLDTAFDYYNDAQKEEVLAGLYGAEAQPVVQREGRLWIANKEAAATEKFLVFAPELETDLGENRDFYWFSDSLVVFASHRAGGYGGMDLYYSTKDKEGAWAVPQNMGAAVNTPYDELAPFLEKDSRHLRFSSMRPDGLGGYDFYESVFSDSLVAWSAPQLLLPPLSSSADDLYWRSHPEGWQVYFASSRSGQLDLYAAYLLQPQAFSTAPYSFVDYLQGRVLPPTPQVVDTIVKQEIKEYSLPTVFYPRSEGTWLGDKILVNQLASILLEHPETTAILTAHTDNSGILHYDAFLATQRAEILAQKLIDRGVQPQQILLRGCGQSYPIAKNETENGSPNSSGRSMNQRIETTILQGKETPIKVSFNLPVVSEMMAATDGEQYRTKVQGLIYKVKVLSSNGFFQHPIFKETKDFSVEKFAQQTKSSYLIGLEKDFAAAQVLLEKARQQGFSEPKIVAYFDGFVLMPEQVEALLEQYPDLKLYWEYVRQ